MSPISNSSRDAQRLDDESLDLLPFLNVDITPERDRHHTNHENRRGSNEHVPHCLAIRVLNGNTSGASQRIRNLHPEITIDVHEVLLLRLGQVLCQRTGEDLLPDGRRDGQADGATDAREHALDGENNGDVLVGGSGHGSHLLADNQATSRKGDKDLAHDNVADVNIGLAELDHQTSAEDGQGHAEVEGNPLEAARVADSETDGDREEARADVVDLRDVAGLGDGQAVDSLEEGTKVRVPDIEADEHGGGEDTRAKNGSVQEQAVGDESHWCEPLLPNCEGNEEKETKDDEADNKGGFPQLGLVGCEVECEQEQGNAGGDEEQANGIELARVVDEGLEGGAAAPTIGEEALLLGDAEVVGEEDPEREGEDWGDDAEDSESPAPSGALAEGVADGARQPSGNWMRST